MKKKPLDIDAVLARHATLIAMTGPRCSVEVSENRELIEALCAKTVNGKPLQNTALSRIVKAETGEDMTPETIARHRRRECRCSK